MTESAAPSADPPAPAPAPAPVAPASHTGKHRHPGHWLLSLLALLIALGSPWWQEAVLRSTPAAESGLDDLRNELAALREQVATNAAPDLNPLVARLETLENRPVSDSPVPGEIHDTQTQLAAALAEIDQIKAGLANVRRELEPVRQQQTAQKTLLAAGLQLSAAWQNGVPFAAPWLALLAAASAADPDLAGRLNDEAPVLLPWRDRGLPTLARLQREFAPAARLAVTAAIPAGENWWQRAQRELQGLVVIRRQGMPVSGEDTATDAVLARAETALAAGDLATAVNEVEKISAPAAAEPLQEWLEAARAHLTAQALAGWLAERAGGYISTEGTTPAVITGDHDGAPSPGAAP